MWLLSPTNFPDQRGANKCLREFPLLLSGSRSLWLLASFRSLAAATTTAATRPPSTTPAAPPAANRRTVRSRALAAVGLAVERPGLARDGLAIQLIDQLGRFDSSVLVRQRCQRQRL